MNLPKRGLLLQSLERAEAAMDAYLRLCGIPPEAVKGRERLSPGITPATTYRYPVWPGYSCVHAIGWLADVNDDLGVRAVLISEIAVCKTPDSPILLARALDLNRRMPGLGRVALLDGGKFLGLELFLDLATVQDHRMGKIIEDHLTAPGAVHNWLSSFGHLELVCKVEEDEVAGTS